MIDIKRILKNPIILFTANRYLGYFLMFIRGILVAKFLEPGMFGVWGFLMLVQQYLSYSGLGIQNALNVDLSIDTSSDKAARSEWIGTALIHTTTTAVLLAVVGAVIQFGNIPLFEKYSFNNYAIFLGVNTGLNLLQELFITVYRAHRKLARIAISEMLTAVTPLLAVLIFRKEETLISYLFGALILQGLITLAQFTIRAPFPIKLKFDTAYWKKLITAGIPLIIYVVSFALITISGRTIVSIYYSAEIMGYYSLANNITTATLLGINAVGFVIFPDILARTHAGIADQTVAAFVQKLSDIYSVSVFFTILMAALVVPALFLYLPQYLPASGTMSILLLSQAIYSVSFGYNIVAIARKQQVKVAAISLFVALVVTGLNLLVAVLKMDFIWIAVAVLIGTFIYTFMQVRLGTQILRLDRNKAGITANIVPWGSLVAILIFAVGILMGYSTLAGVFGLVIFILTSLRKIKLVWYFLTQKFGKQPPAPA